MAERDTKEYWQQISQSAIQRIIDLEAEKHVLEARIYYYEELERQHAQKNNSVFS